MTGSMSIGDDGRLLNSAAVSGKDQLLTRHSGMGTAFATVRNFPNRARQFLGTAGARADRRAAVETLLVSMTQAYGQEVSERAVMASRPNVRRGSDGSVVMNEGKPLSVRRARAILAAAAKDGKGTVAEIAGRFIPSPPGLHPNARTPLQAVADRLFPVVAGHAGVGAGFGAAMTSAQRDAYASLLTDRVATQVRDAHAAGRKPSFDTAQEAAVEILKQIAALDNAGVEAIRGRRQQDEGAV